MATADDSFFSRWSRRKVALRQGQALPPEPVPEPPAAAAPPPAVAGVVAAPAAEPAPTAAPEPAAPTLPDVHQLTPESDFTAFVRPQVQPEVRNAALKKLFADPHFNVMDGLDTYIDDYNTPDPLPEGMLQQLVQSEMLGLFAPAPQDRPDPQPGPQPEPLPPHATGPATDTPAPPAEPAATATPTPTDPTPQVDRHEDADLQLQPDDAAGRPGPDPGAAAHAGRPH